MDEKVSRAAREMVERYGAKAANVAHERVSALAQQSAWKEHDIALRVLTAVEMLLRQQGEGDRASPSSNESDSP